MTTTSTDTAPSPQDFKRPTGRLFVATLLVLTMGAGIWLGYQQHQQQRQLADLTEQLRALPRISASGTVLVETRLTALEQKVAELERKTPPPPDPLLLSLDARVAKLEADIRDPKSLDVLALSKRQETFELKQKQLAEQLPGLTQMQKDAAINQDKIVKRQLEMHDQINKIVKQIHGSPSL